MNVDYYKIIFIQNYYFILLIIIRHFCDHIINYYLVFNILHIINKYLLLILLIMLLSTYTVYNRAQSGSKIDTALTASVLYFKHFMYV